MNNNTSPPITTSTSPVGKTQTTDAIKKRQYFLLGALLLAILAIAFAGVLMSGSTGPKPRGPGPVQGKIIAPGTPVDPKEIWIGTVGAQVRSLETANKELRDKMTVLEEQLRRLEEKGQLPPRLPPQPTLPRKDVDSDKDKTAGTSKDVRGLTPLTIPTTSTKGTQPIVGAPNFTQTTPTVPIRPTGPSGGSQIQPVAPVDTIKTIDLSKRAQGKGGPTQSAKHYIPSGSFTKAIIISGVDAPTNTQAQANPTPVLLRLTDNAFMPNHYRGRLKDCFIVGAAYGDLPSERAYIRTETLSCVGQNGKTIDVSLKGWVSGSDGKAGVRGILVTKQGQALANALMAGIISGLGSAVSLSSQNVNTTALGTVTTVDGADAFRAGIGSGLSKALDRLSKYYLDLADKMHPVIAISAFEKVEVVLTKGISIGDLFENVAGGEDSGRYPAIAARNRAITHSGYLGD